MGGHDTLFIQVPFKLGLLLHSVTSVQLSLSKIIASFPVGADLLLLVFFLNSSHNFLNCHFLPYTKWALIWSCLLVLYLFVGKNVISPRPYLSPTTTTRLSLLWLDGLPWNESNGVHDLSYFRKELVVLLGYFPSGIMIILLIISPAKWTDFI